MAPLAIQLVVGVHPAVLAVPVAFGEGAGRVVATDGHVVGGAQVDAGATVAVLCLPAVHSIAIYGDGLHALGRRGGLREGYAELWLGRVCRGYGLA